jgi:predicted ester cyclase
MSADNRKAYIRRWVEEVWNGGDLARADELMSPDYAMHVLGLPDPPPGPASFKQLCATYRSAFPDVRVTLEDVIVDGERDVCVWRFTFAGTHLGELPGGIAPTGKPVSIGGMVISRFVDSVWVEDWATWDALGMLQQVGAIPAPDQSPVHAG